MHRPLHGGNLAWAATLASCPPEAILDFSASINPLGPPLSAIAAIQAHLRELRVYPDPDYRSLRDSLSQFHQVPPEWILPGNGAAELLTWAGRELAELEATYLLTPAFADYRRALQSFGASIRNVLLPLSLLSTQIPAAPIKLGAVFSWKPSQPLQNQGLLLNNPHNPTGILFDREALMPYLQAFGLVVVDEAFMDFLAPGTEQSLLEFVQDYRNLIIVRSLTKFYSLPGLRLGYAIAHPDHLRRWQQWRDPWPVNALAGAVAEAVLTDVSFQRQTWDWLPRSRLQLFEGLAALSGLQPYPGAANFLLVGTEQPASEVQVRLLQNHQILIRDCLSFPELGERTFRVAVRSQTENQRLLSGLANILA